MATQRVDSATLRGTKDAFNNSATDVESVITTITNSIASLEWTGGIADQFRESFDNEYKPMLGTLKEDMITTATALENKAVQYDEVFGVGG